MKNQGWFAQASAAAFAISFILGGLGAPHLAQAAVPWCSEDIDLRRPGGTLADLPVTDQGSTNLCSFYTAGWLIDAYRQKKEIDLPLENRGTNPIALAVDLANRRNLPIWFPVQNATDPLSDVKLRWGGNVCAAIKQARYGGICRSQRGLTGTPEEMAQLPTKAAEVYMKLFRWGKQTKKKRAAQFDRVAEEVYAMYLDQEPAPEPEHLVSYEEFRSLMSQHARKPYRTIDQLFLQSCDESNRSEGLKLPACHTKVFAGLDFLGIHIGKKDWLRSNRALKTMHNLIRRKDATPVAFAFCHNVIWQGKKYDGDSMLGKNCKAHWGLIAGMKKINGKCHLLVRSGFPSKPASKDWVQDGLDYWVDESYVSRATSMIQYF